MLLGVVSNTRFDQFYIIYFSHIWSIGYLIVVHISPYRLNLIMFLFMIRYVCYSCLHSYKSKLFIKYIQHLTDKSIRKFNKDQWGVGLIWITIKREESNYYSF